MEICTEEHADVLSLYIHRVFTFEIGHTACFYSPLLGHRSVQLSRKARPECTSPYLEAPCQTMSGSLSGTGSLRGLSWICALCRTLSPKFTLRFEAPQQV